MRLLALDTATEACSAALWIDGDVRARFEVAGRAHTQQMLSMVHGLMAEAGLAFAQLDGFICGVGPGSFAGVRIGVGFVKGLALSLDRPVVGVDSLAMLAQGAISASATQVLASIDARMNEVYFGAYARDADGLALPISAPRIAPPHAIRETADGPWFACGTGWGTYEAVLRAGIDTQITHVNGTALPRAEHALKLALPAFAAGAAISADALAPLYLRDKVALTLEEQVQLRESRTRI